MDKHRKNLKGLWKSTDYCVCYVDNDCSINWGYTDGDSDHEMDFFATYSGLFDASIDRGYYFYKVPQVNTVVLNVDHSQ